jgi:hypothetical protein
VALDLKFLSEGAAKNGKNFKSATLDGDLDSNFRGAISIGEPIVEIWWYAKWL